MAETSSTSSPVTRAPLWASMVATFFGIGNLKPGPGTWGSLATVLLWAGLAGFVPAASRPLVAVASAAFVIAIGIPAATHVCDALRTKDAQRVVIDEVAGQLITLIGSPLHWKPLLVGFILFRAFDMTKPPPVRQLESLPNGTGVVMDDVAAGVYGLIVMQLLLRFGILG